MGYCCIHETWRKNEELMNKLKQLDTDPYNNPLPSEEQDFGVGALRF